MPARRRTMEVHRLSNLITRLEVWLLFILCSMSVFNARWVFKLGNSVLQHILGTGGVFRDLSCRWFSLRSALQCLVTAFSHWPDFPSESLPVLPCCHTAQGFESWALRSRFGAPDAPEFTALVANVLGLKLDFGVPRHCAKPLTLIGNGKKMTLRKSYLEFHKVHMENFAWLNCLSWSLPSDCCHKAMLGYFQGKWKASNDGIFPMDFIVSHKAERA